MTDPPALRLSLTLPGGASLGAYQAGAVAALLVAVQALNRRRPTVVVDAVGGASSGSLVALFAARCVLDGLDPDAVMHRAWVERVTLEVLRGRGRGAPLTYDTLRARIGEVLEPRDGAGRRLDQLEVQQVEPLALHVSLTNLQGMTYAVDGIADGHELTATTYVDWGTFPLRPGAGMAQLVEPEGRSPLDHALASAANPGAFAPRLLDRSDDEEGYRANGISGFPESGQLWYTDGALVATEPIGRTLAAARQVAGPDATGPRLHVVVDPRSEGPSGSARWSDPSASPSWTAGMARALSILPAQVLYEDLRRVAATNARLDAVEEVAARLAPALDGDALAAVAEVVGDERTGTGPSSGEDLVRRLLLQVSGLEGRERVHTELISPLLLTDDSGRDVPALLAGEFMGTFGGFLSRRLRESDYVLGWASTRTWLAEGLQRSGIDADGAAAAVAAVDAARDQDWRSVNLGRNGAESLAWGERRSLARLALRVGRVLVDEALGSSRRRGR